MRSLVYTSFSRSAIPCRHRRFVSGDFSAISPNGTCSLCAAYGIPTGPLGGAGYVDALGRPMFANEIYDPLTRATLANGLQYANPFPNNMVPATRFNATALAMQALFPNPNPGNTNLASNYTGSISGGQYSAIPTLKIDEIISAKDKLSFYWSRNNVQTTINTGPFAADGLPLEIGQYRGGLIPTNTWRLNYDRTLTPTLLLHFGAGYMDTIFSDRAPFLSFNPSAIRPHGLYPGPPVSERDRDVLGNSYAGSLWRNAKYRYLRPIAVVDPRGKAYASTPTQPG